MSEEDAQALVASVDTDGNNEIDMDEFIAPNPPLLPPLPVR